MATEKDEPKIAFPKLVDLGGDATILVGPRGCQVRMRVCKALFSFASTYFNALFNNSGFKESGATVQDTDIVHKDDEPDALVNLCKILHMQYIWPKPMSSTEILHLAIVADKYQCVKAIHLAVEPLCPSAIDNWKFNSAAIRDLIVAAYLLDHASLFIEYTHAMLISNSNALNKFTLSEIAQRVSLAAWFELETRRSEILGEIVSIIATLLNRGCIRDKCQRMGDWCLKVTKAAGEILSVAATATISQLLTKAETIKIPKAYDTLPPCGAASPHHPQPTSDKDFKALMKACRRKCKGLCLDCVRAGGKFEGKCRISHD